MVDFSKRSTEIEIMDNLNCSGEVVSRTLVELEIINKWLGGNVVTLDGVERLLATQSLQQTSSLKITDIGCGGGDMLKLLSKQFQKKKLSASFLGIDANPNIVAYARLNTASQPDVTYKTIDILSEEFKYHQCHVMLATLFLHHFNSEQLVKILALLKKQTGVGIVINDLHRHWLAYYSIKFLTKLFSRSSMVKYDAPLSVLRGFTKNELIEILQKAGITNYSLNWKWAFRWQLIIPAH